MPACAIKPEDRQRQIRLVGNDLVKNYGKKKFYTVLEVRNANRRQKIDIDLVCWSHAFFNSHADFDDYHSRMGESCDYIAMKRELFDSVSTSVDSSALADAGLDLDLSWLELPDMDWSLFDFIDL